MFGNLDIFPLLAVPLFIYAGDIMPQFTRALAEVGATVLGVGDQAPGALPDLVRKSLTGYLHVRSLWDEAAVAGELRNWLRGRVLDRIECLWEPGMVLAAQLREALGIPGLNVEQTIPFRDKERMVSISQVER